MIPAESAGWLLPLFRQRELTWSRRRIAALLGLDAGVQARAVRRTRKLLESRGRVGRQELLEHLESGGIDVKGQNAVHHLARLAVLEGVALLGPEERTKTTYVLAREWIGDSPPASRKQGMEELARWHLGGFGPTDHRDMAAWSGLGQGQCRKAMQRIAAELVEVEMEGERKWTLRDRPPRSSRGPQVRLLPAFDNHLMGHSSRDIAVPAAQVKRVWPGAGIVRATVLIDGVAVATWGARRTGGEIRVSLDPFAPLDDRTSAAIEREVRDIGRFEGLTPVMVN